MSKHSSLTPSSNDSLKIRSQLNEQLVTPAKTFRGHENEWSQDLFSGDDHAILKIRSQLKEQLTTPSKRFRGHEKEWSQVHDLVLRTVTMGESNSVLIIGPSGCGKTTFINCILNDLTKMDSLKEHWLVVNLEGMLHSTDHLALLDATMQMGLENVVDGKVFGSCAENLKFLFDSLKAGDKEQSKAVIFILEEFDLFCDHHNQSLLYNLFDVAQSQRAPICVIGLTCRLDVTELLEKRVKSRFSHRQVYLFPINQDFDEHLALCKDKLQVSKTKVFRRCTVDLWNKHIEELMKNPSVKAVLKRMYEIDVSESALRAFLIPLVCRLSNNCTRFLPSDFTECMNESLIDSKTREIESLSVLEVSLLIAMKHHFEIYDGEPFNFEVILKRYLAFISKNNTSQTKSRPVIMMAYEKLLLLEFIEPITKTGTKTKTLQGYQLCNLMILPSQLKDALKRYKNLPTDIEQWAISSLQ